MNTEKKFTIYKPSFILVSKEVILTIISLIALLYLYYWCPVSFLEKIPGNILIIIFYLLILCVVITTILFVVQALRIATTKFVITDETIDMQKGIFFIQKDFLEIYRIKDYRIEASFWLRLFHLSNFIIYSSDKTHPQLEIKGIKEADEFYHCLREKVENERRKKGVREID